MARVFAIRNTAKRRAVERLRVLEREREAILARFPDLASERCCPLPIRRRAKTSRQPRKPDRKPYQPREALRPKFRERFH
jgi:hypothetical protein